MNTSQDQQLIPAETIEKAADHIALPAIRGERKPLNVARGETASGQSRFPYNGLVPALIDVPNA